MISRTLRVSLLLGSLSLLALTLPVASVHAQMPAQETEEKPVLPQDKGIPVELSLSSAVLFALHDNPQIGIQKERVTQAHYFAEEGKADYYPRVELFAEGGREFNDPAAGIAPKSKVNNSGNLNVAMEQLLFDGFGTIEEARRRETLVKSAAWRKEAAKEEVLTETVRNYLDILQYQRSLEDAKVFIEEISKTVATIEELFEAGAASKAMLDYARSREAFATTQMTNTLSSLNDAISNLEFLTGKLPPNFVAQAPERLDPDKLDLQYYLEATEALNSQAKINQYDAAAMKHQLKVEKADYFPTVNFRVEADQTYNSGGEVGTETTVAANFRLTYTLFDGFARKNATRRVNSQINELLIKDKQISKELRREIKLAYNQIEAIQQSLETTRAEIQSNIALQGLNQENFRLGNINVIELIEGEERLHASRVKEHELTHDLYFNTYSLLIMAGLIDEDFFCQSCIDQDENIEEASYVPTGKP